MQLARRFDLDDPTEAKLALIIERKGTTAPAHTEAEGKYSDDVAYLKVSFEIYFVVQLMYCLLQMMNFIQNDESYEDWYTGRSRCYG